MPVWQSWTITPSVVIGGTVPAPGERERDPHDFGAEGRIDALTFVDEPPRVTVLEFEKAAGAEGRLTLDAAAADARRAPPISA